MLTFNFILTCMVIWVVMFINHRYFMPALLNRERFKLFALRDQLAELAMRGVMPAESKEYLILLKLLNSSINVLGKFSIVDFLKFLISIQINDKLRKQVDEIMDTLNHSDKAYKVIVQQYFEVMLHMLEKQTKLFKHGLYPVFFFLGPVKRRAAQIEEINSNMNMRLTQADSAMNHC